MVVLFRDGMVETVFMMSENIIFQSDLVFNYFQFFNNPNAKKYKKEERCENVNSIAQLCDTSNLTLLENT